MSNWTGRYSEKWPRLTALFNLDGNNRGEGGEQNMRFEQPYPQDPDAYYKFYLHPDDIGQSRSISQYSVRGSDAEKVKHTSQSSPLRVCLGTMLLFSLSGVICVAITLTVLLSQPQNHSLSYVTVSPGNDTRYSAAFISMKEKQLDKEICDLMKTMFKLNNSTKTSALAHCNISLEMKDGHLKLHFKVPTPTKFIEEDMGKIKVKLLLNAKKAGLFSDLDDLLLDDKNNTVVIKPFHDEHTENLLNIFKTSTFTPRVNQQDTFSNKLKPLNLTKFNTEESRTTTDSVMNTIPQHMFDDLFSTAFHNKHGMPLGTSKPLEVTREPHATHVEDALLRQLHKDLLTPIHHLSQGGIIPEITTENPTILMEPRNKTFPHHSDEDMILAKTSHDIHDIPSDWSLSDHNVQTEDPLHIGQHSGLSMGNLNDMLQRMPLHPEDTLLTGFEHDMNLDGFLHSTEDFLSHQDLNNSSEKNTTQLLPKESATSIQSVSSQPTNVSDILSHQEYKLSASSFNISAETDTFIVSSSVSDISRVMSSSLAHDRYFKHIPNLISDIYASTQKLHDIKTSRLPVITSGDIHRRQGVETDRDISYSTTSSLELEPSYTSMNDFTQLSVHNSASVPNLSDIRSSSNTDISVSVSDMQSSSFRDINMLVTSLPRIAGIDTFHFDSSQELGVNNAITKSIGFEESDTIQERSSISENTFSVFVDVDHALPFTPERMNYTSTMNVDSLTASSFKVLISPSSVLIKQDVSSTKVPYSNISSSVFLSPHNSSYITTGLSMKTLHKLLDSSRAIDVNNETQNAVLVESSSHTQIQTKSINGSFDVSAKLSEALNPVSVVISSVQLPQETVSSLMSSYVDVHNPNLMPKPSSSTVNNFNEYLERHLSENFEVTSKDFNIVSSIDMDRFFDENYRTKHYSLSNNIVMETYVSDSTHETNKIVSSDAINRFVSPYQVKEILRLDITTQVSSSYGATQIMASDGSQVMTSDVISQILAANISQQTTSFERTSNRMDWDLSSQPMSTDGTYQRTSSYDSNEIMVSGMKNHSNSSDDTSQIMSSDITSKIMSSTISSHTMSPDVISHTMSYYVTSNITSSDVTIQKMSDVTSQMIFSNVTSQMMSSDVTSQMTSSDVTSQMMSSYVASQITPTVTSQMMSSDVTSQMTSPDVTSQMTSSDVTSQMTSSDVTTQMTSSDDTSQKMTSDITRKITPSYVTSQAMPSHVTSPMIFSGFISQAMPSDFTIQILSSDISGQNMSFDDISQTMSSFKTSQMISSFDTAHIMSPDVTTKASQMLSSNIAPRTSSSVIFNSPVYTIVNASAGEINYTSNIYPIDVRDISTTERVMMTSVPYDTIVTSVSSNHHTRLLSVRANELSPSVSPSYFYSDTVSVVMESSTPSHFYSDTVSDVMESSTPSHFYSDTVSDVMESSTPSYLYSDTVSDVMESSTPSYFYSDTVSDVMESSTPVLMSSNSVLKSQIPYTHEIQSTKASSQIKTRKLEGSTDRMLFYSMSSNSELSHKEISTLTVNPSSSFSYLYISISIPTEELSVLNQRAPSKDMLSSTTSQTIPLTDSSIISNESSSSLQIVKTGSIQVIHPDDSVGIWDKSIVSINPSSADLVTPSTEGISISYSMHSVNADMTSMNHISTSTSSLIVSSLTNSTTGITSFPDATQNITDSNLNFTHGMFNKTEMTPNFKESSLNVKASTNYSAPQLSMIPLSLVTSGSPLVTTLSLHIQPLLSLASSATQAPERAVTASDTKTNEQLARKQDTTKISINTEVITARNKAGDVSTTESIYPVSQNARNKAGAVNTTENVYPVSQNARNKAGAVSTTESVYPVSQNARNKGGAASTTESVYPVSQNARNKAGAVSTTENVYPVSQNARNKAGAVSTSTESVYPVSQNAATKRTDDVFTTEGLDKDERSTTTRNMTNLITTRIIPHVPSTSIPVTRSPVFTLSVTRRPRLTEVPPRGFLPATSRTSVPRTAILLDQSDTKRLSGTPTPTKRTNTNERLNPRRQNGLQNTGILRNIPRRNRVNTQMPTRNQDFMSRPFRNRVINNMRPTANNFVNSQRLNPSNNGLLLFNIPGMNNRRFGGANINWNNILRG